MDYPKSVPGVGLVGGKFIDENVQTGQQGSLIPAAWGNAVTDEILAVIAGAGLTPNESTYDQLLEAIETLIASGAATYENSAAVLLADGVASAGARNTAARGDHRHPTDNTSVVAPGFVLPFAGNAAPDGWLKANGIAVSRATYSALFSAIGTKYGVGDGSSTFNLPDLRAEFIRGFDDGRGVDVDRVLGSSQADELKTHTHTINEGSANPQSGGALSSGDDYTSIVYKQQTSSSTGGAETRPRNVALLYCIKY